jgi:rRNA maturation endonuclease Nob1
MIVVNNKIDTHPSETSLYVCQDCGTSVETEYPDECSECGGKLRNTTFRTTNHRPADNSARTDERIVRRETNKNRG